MNTTKTNEKILHAAQGLLASDGFGAVSFDAIARKLGISKQAVLYWFPSKRDLLVAMFVGWLSAEADEAAACLEGASDPDEAVATFVRVIAEFHLGDLDRFRMMYLAPQTLKASTQVTQDDQLLEQVHATTSRMYGVLAEHLSGNPRQARQEAVAIHSAVLGLVLMFGLADGVGDPLKHSQDDLVAALITRLTA